MASFIQTLDIRTSMKIAAGEVIDRPASIIRELLDNSLDAGATEISISLERGGKKFLSVLDNGHGMSSEDIAKAYLKHTTSKISNFDDLSSLLSYGFRGEALASIAEVAELSLASCSIDEECGSEILVSFGVSGAITKKAMNVGTSVIVSSLFKTMPARIKFLSSESQEYRMILQEIFKKALTKPEVRFDLQHDFQNKLSLLSTDNLLNRILAIFPDLSGIISSFAYSENGLNVYGFFSDPSWHRSNRSYQYLFVNKRPVDSAMFRTQTLLAYNNLLPKSRFPAVFCYLDLSPSFVDFNVHPQKQEVRFENETAIADLIRRALRKALNTSDSSRSFEILRPEKSEFIPRDSFRIQNLDLFSSSTKETSYSEPNFVHLLSKSLYKGTIFATYLLFEYENKAFFVDFHAMHERIRYEDILKQRSANINSHQVLPFVLEFSIDLMEHFDQINPMFKDVGFFMHRLTATSISVEAIPSCVDLSKAEMVLRDLFQSKIKLNLQNSECWDYFCKTIACKGSVRAGDTLVKSEVDALLEKWAQCEFFQSCPHGRPIVHVLDKYYFDKVFKRTGF